MSDDVLIRVEGVSKRFCRDLKQSLWYGVQDMAGDCLGWNDNEPKLRRDEFWAVDNVSFELKRGECLGLIGHNGSGKTTLLKMISGLIKPDKGRIEIRGRVGALIALGAGFNPILTGRENIYVNGSVLGLAKREIDEKIEEIIEFAEIGEFIDAPVQSYSSGMSVRLGFAVATAMEPDILLLDEVLAVGDMAFQAKCLSRIAKIKTTGCAFVFVSHNTHQMAMICDRGLTLQNGTVLADDSLKAALAVYRSSQLSSLPETEIWSGNVLRVLSVKLESNGKNVLDSRCAPHSKLSLTLHVDCARELDVTIDMRALDSIGTMYQNTNDSLGIPISVPVGQSEISIAIDGIARHGDRINFNVAVWGREERVILCWVRGIGTEIDADPLSSGRDILKVSYGA